MVNDVNQTYCGGHFAVYTNIKLCHAPETDRMLYVNYTWIKERKKGSTVADATERSNNLRPKKCALMWAK